MPANSSGMKVAVDCPEFPTTAAPFTNDVVGRPTELRLFYKIREQDNFVVYFPNFNLTKSDHRKAEFLRSPDIETVPIAL